MLPRVNILQKINVVYEKSKDSNLKPTIFNKVSSELKYVASYLKLESIDAFFFSIFFSHNQEQGNSVNFREVASHFDCSTVKVLEYIDNINRLTEKGYFQKEIRSRNEDVAYADYEFYANKDISKAIIRKKPFPKFKKLILTSVIDFIEKLFLLSEQVDDDKMTINNLLDTSETLIENHLHLSFVENINKLKLDRKEAYLFYYLIWKTLTGNSDTDIEKSIEYVELRPSKRISFLQKFILPKKNKLLRNKLIHIEHQEFINNSRMELSKKSLSMLEEENIKLFFKQEEKKKDGQIRPKDIVKIKLFYNEKEEQQIALFQKALGKVNFKALQKRLREKHLPNGITALFYGFPGTGKTESVLQIAKQTGRAIMKVDISQTKSMWFGESEKIIKKIFTDYYKLKEREKVTPILFFNEADAIISKRQSVNSSNLAKTENTIQNIILEELEIFDGIFIATTNLISNMDSAFDRRFLFKVEFDKPNIEVKAKIWKVKLKRLPIRDCKLLAERFDFSGGQINNIVRKAEMSEVINGTRTSTQDIIRFGKEEQFGKSSAKKIGFSN